jgi:two-component system cell cycle response regulator
MSARILVIEDNPTNLDLMTYLLKAFGYETLVAQDGEVGLELASRERPDLIICDIQIPKVDGYEVARLLKSDPTLRAIPLVAVTAYAMVDDRDKALAAGFDGYITKPIEPETFVQQVEVFFADFSASAPLLAWSSVEAPPYSSASLGVTLLVVDNSRANIQLICSTFEPLGYTVISAERVHQALAILQERVPDLIISDIHIQEQTGFDLLEVVKADPRLRHIPFVFLTSTVFGSRDEKLALGMGADRFLVRPIVTTVLIAAIEACLHHGRE